MLWWAGHFASELADLPQSSLQHFQLVKKMAADLILFALLEGARARSVAEVDSQAENPRNGRVCSVGIMGRSRLTGGLLVGGIL